MIEHADETVTMKGAADLLGMDIEKLKLWHQRGHTGVDAKGKWARFDFFDLLRLFATKKLVDSGYPVGKAAAIAEGVRLDMVRFLTGSPSDPWFCVVRPGQTPEVKVITGLNELYKEQSKFSSDAEDFPVMHVIHLTAIVSAFLTRNSANN